MMSAIPAALPAICFPSDLSCWGGKVAQSAFAAVVNALGEGVIACLKFVSTFWLAVPSPTVATGSGSSWTVAFAVGQTQAWLAPVTASIAVVSFVVGVGRVAWTGRASEARLVVRQVVAVAAGSLVVVAGTQLLITAGDAFSPWLLQQASGGSPSAGLETLIVTGLAGGRPDTAIGMWFVLFLLCLLGGLVQCIFMVVRGAALVVLMVFVPAVAAGAASDDGWTRYKRLVVLIVGFALYKPVAAVIYAVGILQMSRNGGGVGGAGGDLQSAIYGLTIMVLAALALPAFIKFLMPVAATGSSSVFSGAAALGAVAAGAVVVAGGGWGSAAGAGSSGASGNSGAAGAAASAGSPGSAGSVGGASPAGAASPPPSSPPASSPPVSGSGGSSGSGTRPPGGSSGPSGSPGSGGSSGAGSAPPGSAPPSGSGTSAPGGSGSSGSSVSGRSVMGGVAAAGQSGLSGSGSPPDEGEDTAGQGAG